MSDEEKDDAYGKYVRKKMAKMSGTEEFSPWHEGKKIKHEDKLVIHERPQFGD
jgi:hypothetical protein